MTHLTPRPVIVPTQTVRRGEVPDAEARVRWRKRRVPVPDGWTAAILEINGQPYVAEAFRADDTEGRHFLIVDLHARGKHHRLTLSQGQEQCDCEHPTYRGVPRKYVAGVMVALDQLDALERAEWEATLADTDLQRPLDPF